MDDDRVNRFMEDLQAISPDKVEIIKPIRTIFLAADKNLTEEIKYGGLVFMLGNVLLGGIFPYKDHISIEFSHGAEFPDPSAILEGKGKNRRHLKIVKKKDINDKNVKTFVAEAVKNQNNR
ncbi:MAG: DUF1801 domain-containing protein [Gammaproteobacteria bacterium]|nr:DUF1801 domain-containing protein [Gammaproteobacteria bacterium]